MRIYALLLSVLLCTPAYAKGGKSSGKKTNEMVFASLGAGTATINDPEDVMDMGAIAAMDVGAEFKIFGPVYIPVAVIGDAGWGKVQYDYTDPETNTRYQAPDIGFTRTSLGLRAGLKIRVINGDHMHVYTDGGVYYMMSTLNYNTSGNLILLAQGLKPLASEKDVLDFGTYGEAGVEFLIGKFGIRFAGRAMAGQTGKYKALANQNLKHKDALALIGLVKNL